MTVLDTKTGAIVAIGGGRNYSEQDWNFATDQKRQPGSAIKPITIIMVLQLKFELVNWSN